MFDLGDFTGDGCAAAGNTSLLTEAMGAGVNMAANLIPSAISNSPTVSPPKNVM